MPGKTWNIRQRELAHVLDRLGWSADDLFAYLRGLAVDVDLATIESWLSLTADEALAPLPRWPALLVRSHLLGSSDVVLRHFAATEFRSWWLRMAPQLLHGLDYLRELLGQPVIISPAADALGRYAGKENTLHNVEKYGGVFAVDVMLPKGPRIELAFEIAVFCRVFSGIGVYPDWRPYPGLHLDVRHVTGISPTPDASTISPATWGAIRDRNGRQVYVAVSQAIGR